MLRIFVERIRAGSRVQTTVSQKSEHSLFMHQRCSAWMKACSAYRLLLRARPDG